MNSTRKNIIYVEDRPEDVAMVERILKKEFENVSLSVFTDSEKALKEIETERLMKRTPHFLLIDIKMPKVSGFDLLKALDSNKSYAHLPRVIFSSSSQKSDITEAYNLRCNSYIEKPSTYNQLKETLLCTVGYWLDYNRN